MVRTASTQFLGLVSLALAGAAALAVLELTATEVAADSGAQKASSLRLSAKEVPSDWIRLLHYRRALLGGYTNEAGSSFFITENGPEDPWGEYEASRIELARPGSDFACRFPARALLLRRLDSRIPAASTVCPDWEAFRKRLAASGASVVFSSYYLNNPASAFGHSFLRIHRAFLAQQGSGTSSSDHGGKAGRDFESRQTELLDTGLGYAATVTSSNAIVYGFNGIFGLFRGDYTAMPYYYKVREYADSENRDLWSYELKLSPAELELLVAHIWELGRANRRYYYFSKNCSYEILAVIEAVLDRSRGSIGLLERMPWFVIPSHTLQSLMQEPDLVGQIGYRPSIRKQLESRLQRLTSEQRQMARDWERSPSDASMGVEILDARIDWIDFKYYNDLIHDEPISSAIKQEALAARAATGVLRSDAARAIPMDSEPSRGHPPRRIQLGVRRLGSDSDLSATLGIRAALQDLLDPATGYPDSARLEFGNVLLSYRDRLRVDEFGLFRAQSVAPVSRVKLDPSWKVGLVLDRQSAARGSDDLAGSFEVSGGLTLPLLQGPMALRFFSLLGTRTHLGKAPASRWFRPALSAEVGLHGRWGDRMALLARAQGLRFVSAWVAAEDFIRWMASIDLRYTFNPRWGISGGGSWDPAATKDSWRFSWTSGISYFF